MHERGDWGLLHILCFVHASARTITRTFGLAPELITGCIQVSLSLKVGTAMRSFRNVMRKLIMDRLEFVESRPSAEAMQHKEMVCQQFLDKGPKWRKRVATLMAVPTGDWRARGRVEGVVLPGSRLDRAAFEVTYLTSLVNALAGRAPPTNPRR